MDRERRRPGERIHARFSIESAHWWRARWRRKKAETIVGDEALTIATNPHGYDVGGAPLPPRAGVF